MYVGCGEYGGTTMVVGKNIQVVGVGVWSEPPKTKTRERALSVCPSALPSTTLVQEKGGKRSDCESVRESLLPWCITYHVPHVWYGTTRTLVHDCEGSERNSPDVYLH
jgi:hypothetical protein